MHWRRRSRSRPPVAAATVFEPKQYMCMYEHRARAPAARHHGVNIMPPTLPVKSAFLFCPAVHSSGSHAFLVLFCAINSLSLATFARRARSRQAKKLLCCHCSACSVQNKTSMRYSGFRKSICTACGIKAANCEKADIDHWRGTVVAMDRTSQPSARMITSKAICWCCDDNRHHAINELRHGHITVQGWTNLHRELPAHKPVAQRLKFCTFCRKGDGDVASRFLLLE